MCSERIYLHHFMRMMSCWCMSLITLVHSLIYASIGSIYFSEPFSKSNSFLVSEISGSSLLLFLICIVPVWESLLSFCTKGKTKEVSGVEFILTAKHTLLLLCSISLSISPTICNWGDWSNEQWPQRWKLLLVFPQGGRDGRYHKTNGIG